MNLAAVPESVVRLKIVIQAEMILSEDVGQRLVKLFPVDPQVIEKVTIWTVLKDQVHWTCNGTRTAKHMEHFNRRLLRRKSTLVKS